jgi:hypothetical protein
MMILLDARLDRGKGTLPQLERRHVVAGGMTGTRLCEFPRTQF